MYDFRQRICLLALLVLSAFPGSIDAQSIECEEEEDCDGTVSCQLAGRPLCELLCIGKDACKDFDTTINFCGNKDCLVLCDGQVACGPATFAAAAGGCDNRNCVVLTDRSDDDNSLGLVATGFDEYDISVGLGPCGTCCSDLNSLDNNNNAFILNGCFLGCSGSSCDGPNDNFKASCVVGQSYLTETPVTFTPPSSAGVDNSLLNEFTCVGGTLVAGAVTQSPTTAAPTQSTDTPTTAAPTTAGPTTAAPTPLGGVGLTSSPTPSANGEGLDLLLVAGVAGGVVGILGIALIAQRRRQRISKSTDEVQVQAQAPGDLSRRLEPKPPSRPSSVYLDRIKRSSVKSIFRPSSTYLKRAENNRQGARFGEVESIDNDI